MNATQKRIVERWKKEKAISSYIPTFQVNKMAELAEDEMIREMLGRPQYSLKWIWVIAFSLLCFAGAAILLYLAL